MPSSRCYRRDRVADDVSTSLCSYFPSRGHVEGYRPSVHASEGVHADPDRRHEGREVIRAYIEQVDRPFSDISMETSQLIEEGNMIVAEWGWRAMNTGPFDNASGMRQSGLLPRTYPACGDPLIHTFSEGPRSHQLPGGPVEGQMARNERVKECSASGR
jgi:SnoaL-like domain